MAFESTSSQQSSQLSPSSKVNFKCEDGIIAFNNTVALLEHSNVLYHLMLSFLSKCCIGAALTIQPFAIYVEYLREFWYTAEVDDATKTITFSLSSLKKPLYFTQDEFISAIGLPACSNAISLPPKETVDIGAIIFSDLVHKLQNRKKNMEPNICYTRFLSLIFKKLSGENYMNDFLTFIKPHTIKAASFHKPLASKVSLTSHMLKVAKLSQQLEQSLILPSDKVSPDDVADKCLSRTTVQLVTQPKAPTDMKIKKKQIPPSSKPKSSYKIRVILLKKQVAETQHAEETVATADATQSLVAFESAEEQANQPETAKSEKEEVKAPRLESIGDVTFEQIMDEIDQQNQAAQDKLETPYDTESEIKIIKRFQPSQPDDDAQITFLNVEPYDPTKSRDADSDSDSGLQSMPDDDLPSLSGFETPDSQDEDSQSDDNLHASVDVPAKSDPLGYLQEELRTLSTKVDNLESTISKKVSEDVQSSVASFVTTTLKDLLPSLLLEALKETLPSLIQASVHQAVQKSVEEQLPMFKAQIL
ncbi:hypothetical protein Tco_1128768 [Tanacetum coccineum]